MKEYIGKINFPIEFEKITVKKHNSKNNLTDYKNKILYLEHSITSILNYIPYVKGIILKEGSVLSHVSIVARELKMPSLIDVDDSFSKIFKDEVLVSINQNKISVSKENYLVPKDIMIRVSKKNNKYYVNKEEITEKEFQIIKQLQKKNLKQISSEENVEFIEKLIKKELFVFSKENVCFKSKE